MKRILLIATLLLSYGAASYGQTYNWDAAIDGNLDDATRWTPAGFIPNGARMTLAQSGDYKVGLGDNMDAYSLAFNGTSGIVALDLGTQRLKLDSTFNVRQDIAFTSGEIVGLIQLGYAVTGKTFTVSGPNTSFNSSGGAYVGRNTAVVAASNNHLTISAGASFTAASALVIGDNITGAATNNNSITVTGLNSKLKVGSMLIGNLAGTDSPSQSSGNKLIVTDGASVETGSLTISRRGTGVTSSETKGNKVTVGGGANASTLTATAGVTIGTPGGDNTLTVLANGTVYAAGGTTTLNNGPTSGPVNALIIDGGTYLATGQKLLGYGNSSFDVLDGGTLIAGHLDLRSNLNISGKAALEFDQVTLWGGGGAISNVNISINSATEYGQIKINSSEAFVFNGNFSLTFTDGFEASAGDEFQLLSFTSATGEFARFEMPTLGNGLRWDTERFYQTGTLAVIPEPGGVSLSIAFLGVLAGRFYTKRLKRL